MEVQNQDVDLKLKKIFRNLSILFFALSLTQKCFCTTANCSDSFMVLLLGWAGIFSGYGFSWLANPLLIVAWITLKNKLKVSMMFSALAFLISMSFLMLSSITDNEGGIAHEIISYKPGFYLWIASTGCMLIGTFTLMLRHNTRMAEIHGGRWSSDPHGIYKNK